MPHGPQLSGSLAVFRQWSEQRERPDPQAGEQATRESVEPLQLPLLEPAPLLKPAPRELVAPQLVARELPEPPLLPPEVLAPEPVLPEP